MLWTILHSKKSIVLLLQYTFYDRWCTQSDHFLHCKIEFKRFKICSVFWEGLSIVRVSFSWEGGLSAPKNFQRALCRKLFRAKSECFDMFLVPVVISLALLEVIQINEKYPFHMSMANPNKFFLCLPRKKFTSVSAL